MPQKKVTDDFWRDKPLSVMTEAEWEALCDGCARCCLNKLEDADTGEIAWTDVACRLLDPQSCRCRSYADRSSVVSDCIGLTADMIEELGWLPSTCAYRLLAEGRELPWWHKLVSGDSSSVHAACISVRGKVVSEEDFPVEHYEDRIVLWPNIDPYAGK